MHNSQFYLSPSLLAPTPFSYSTSTSDSGSSTSSSNVCCTTFYPSNPPPDSAVQPVWYSEGSGTASDAYRRVSDASLRVAFSTNTRKSSLTSSPEYRYFLAKGFAARSFYASSFPAISTKTTKPVVGVEKKPKNLSRRSELAMSALMQ